MRQSLEKFHANKGVFSRYRAGKTQSSKANIALKEMSLAGRQELAAAKGSGATRTQVEKLTKDL